ncbi:MAG: nicotinate-nucleotide adenylyltransferase [Armatimonadetes bacterium]|nr:nicotinate-nucleotide adenylyltransferase [Armatimonadota bacterium]
MSPGPLRIGILGGTLDPVHHGHLFAAAEAQAACRLDRVLFIPCGHAPHKAEDEVTPAEHRYLMCVLATASNSGFRVSRLEIDRPGPSYTIDTLRELRAIHGQTTELVFIMGADAVREIDSWHMPDAVLAEARCVAVPRPGSELADLPSVLDRGRADRIEILDLPALDISATEIRRRVRAGRPIRYLTPDPVVDYIAREGLYVQAREN